MRISRPGQSRAHVILFLTIALVVGLGGWWVFAHFLRPSVLVTTIVNGPVVQAFYATGTVQPRHEYPIRAPTAGTLEKVLVDKGATIKVGDPLAIINDPVLKYAVDRAKADLEEKKLRANEKTSPVIVEYDARISAMKDMLAIAQRDLDRVKGMVERNAASSTDEDRASDLVKQRWAESQSFVAQRQAKLFELNRELQTAQAAYDSALWNYNEQTLKAPIDGVVLDRPIAQGTRVAVNDPIMRIANVVPVNLVMRAQVDEEDVTQCRVGQKVKMTLYAFRGAAVTGTVQKIYDEADHDRRTFEVDVELDDKSLPIASGMTGELAFVVAEKASADIIPAQSLQGGAVYVVHDGKIEKKTPEIGLKSVERIEIKSGLDPADKVIISPISGYSPGQTVRQELIDPQQLYKDQKAAEAAKQSSFKGFAG